MNRRDLIMNRRDLMRCLQIGFVSTVTSVALVASLTSCTSDTPCDRQEDCPSGQICAFPVHICVPTTTADLTLPPAGDMTQSGDMPAQSDDMGDMGSGGDGGSDMGPHLRFSTGMAATGSLGGELDHPSAVCFGGSKLYVSDTNNHRVLVYNMLADKAAPMGAIGQADLVAHKTASAPPTASSLNQPLGLWCDDTSLLVADSKNNRVLFYETNPTTSSAADGVAGQPSFIVADTNRKGAMPAANSLYSPHDVTWDGKRLYIADSANYRVVGYPAKTKADLKQLAMGSADVVFGQATFGTRTKPAAASATTIAYPVGLRLDGDRLAVADLDYGRVTVYTVPTTFVMGTALSADAVIGQKTLTDKAAGTDAMGLSMPIGVLVDNGETFVADSANSRVLVYEQKLPAAGTLGETAAAAIGQKMIGPPVTPAGNGAADLNHPSSMIVATANGITYLVVADTINNRVQLFRAQ